MNDKTGSTPPQPIWANAGAYERFVGRWSRLAAREFVAWLGAAPGSAWLDVGCGTGALCQTILQVAEPRQVKGIDSSAGFIAFAQAQVQDARASFQVGDAQELPDTAASYDAAVSGLVLNHLPQPERATSEMARVVKGGGVVAVYVWDYAGIVQFLRLFWDAAVALDPAASGLHQGRRYPLCQTEPLTELFQSAGLEKVEVQGIDIPTHFQDFDDYWSPFLAGQGPAPAYVVSLSEERRAALRERIRHDLPFASDGSIPLVARVWAVRGYKR